MSPGRTPARTPFAVLGGLSFDAMNRNVFVPEPTERHGEILEALFARVDRADLVPDAHLAALAIEYGLILCSTDGDLARFPKLRWQNPLQG